MKSILVALCSTLMTSAVIGNAFYQKKQFYPSVVYVTKSNPSMAVIYIQAFVFVLLMGKVMRKVFFGQLRPTEMEHLIERSWYAITETCLAFTVFRDDFSPKFVALFTLLLFLKCFHWLAEDRVDYMERSPVISWLFHIRIVSLLLLLGTLDFLFVNHAYHSTLVKGASVQLVFGFEYAILWTIVANTFLKYILHTLDINSENPWENKAVYLLYSELVMGFFKVMLYLIFMVIMIKIHTFPLFAIRPMYLSIRAFKEALNDVVLSRRAIRNMNTLYPDATAEELRTVDNVCIICREEMQGGAGNSKKLPCNHIFHAACLRSWFQRQQTCPTCRMDVLRSPPQQAQAGAGAQQAAPAANQAPQAANQGAQPQAHWNLPNLPPMWPPFMPPMPAFVPPTPPPATTPQQPGSSGEPSAPQQSSSAGPQAPPPFPFFPFFLPPPPPPPPADLRSLSEEELRRMEGQERSHLEARVQCLRNIQTLLDAATLQMFQYSSLVAHLSRIQATSAAVPPSAASTSSAPAGPSPSTSSTSSSTSKLSADPLSTPSTSSTEVAGASPDPQEEVRRLRLQKFGTQQNSTSSEASPASPTKKTD